MAKSLTQLVPDFREALEEGVQQATKPWCEICRWRDLTGPAFSPMSGRSTLATRRSRANIQNPLEVPKEPKTPQYVDIDVPESPDLQGYTIGNRAEYRLYAMDIINAGPRANPNARLTADKKWYDKYINSQMPGVIDQQITNVFRRYR